MHHDRHAAQRLPLLFPACACRLPAPLEISQRRVVAGRMGRIQCCKPIAEGTGDLFDIARVQVDMRIASGVHVTLGAIQRGGLFQHGDMIGGFEITGGTGLHGWITGAAQQHRQQQHRAMPGRGWRARRTRAIRPGLAWM